MADQKVSFTVKRVTKGRKMCETCRGTGKKEMKINGLFKQVPCSWCQNGVTTVEHMTEVDLIDALTELGIKFVLPASMKPKELTTETTD